MNDEELVIGETDFTIVDKKELIELKSKKESKISGNLKDDLINLGFVDYEDLDEKDREIFDELENEKRDSDFYET
ncbi:MAG TPA: hypothetical protein PKX34_00460 [Candidatus Absconditabacterales bacterium]|nr:hypothetical protein [Candidatus Absconditabacterales bacterium]